MVFPGALLVAPGASVPLPRNINKSSLSFNPVLFITLNSPEKDLVAKTGDLNLQSWFGLCTNMPCTWIKVLGTMFSMRRLPARSKLPKSMNSCSGSPVVAKIAALSFNCNSRVNPRRGKAALGVLDGKTASALRIIDHS